MKAQYAYLISRQTTDALDRAYAHSQLINKQVASIRPDPFAASKRHSTLLRGGIQLSLDLSKAFDRLPRAHLRKSLERIHTPPDLISLILYLHKKWS